jgi:tryptophan synthase alpha subunit
MRLSEAIAKGNAAGRFGLLLYSIPNFPDPESYRQTIDLLNKAEELSILETTVPVTRRFSAHANQTIVRAHRQAAQFWGREPHPVVNVPELCVLYRQTVEELGFRAALAAHRFQGALLEWDEPAPAPYAEAAREAGVELVQCVGPETPESDVRELLALSDPGGLVYLMSASMTGAQLQPTAVLSRCVRRVKAVRPDVKVAAGFGIRGPGEVRRLKEVDGLDAVIIGTAFLDAVADGPVAVCEFLGPVMEAL